MPGDTCKAGEGGEKCECLDDIYCAIMLYLIS